MKCSHRFGKGRSSRPAHRGRKTTVFLETGFPTGSSLAVARGLLLLVLVLLVFVPCPAGAGSESDVWKDLDEGLKVAEFSSSPSDDVEYKITVVKVDPRFYAFKLIAASENGREKLTAREWSQRFNLVAAVNSGMYQEDGLSSVGYMKNFDHINNPRLGKDKTVLAFNPVGRELPEVQIIDRECQDFEVLRRKYRTMVQSIRMISCDQENVWSRQAGKWSTVAIGTDDAGKVLLLFCRSPITVHDFVEVLLSLPLSLHRAMYLEGGPQASLYLSTGKTTLERYGSWEPTFEENNPILIPMPIPNVIGIVKKTH